MRKTDGELLAGSGMMFSRSAFLPVTGLIIIIVMPRSRMVAEMKPHAWAEVHGYARAMMASPIANVVLVNITTVV